MEFLDRFEAYQIICEVLFEYVPEELRKSALAQAADRLYYEIKNTKDD